MFTLIHTGMQVPDDQVHLADMQQIDIGRAIAWTALVRQGTRILGRATNNGNGATLFHHHDRAGREAMAAYVAHCRARDGEAMTEEFVLGTLAEEHAYTHDVADAFANGRFLVRCFDDLDIPALWSLALTRARPPHYQAALAAVGGHELPPTAVRAELWMGPEKGWVQFYPDPEQGDPA